MKQNKSATSYALVALSFLSLASSAVSPVLASVGEAYPDISSTILSADHASLSFGYSNDLDLRPYGREEGIIPHIDDLRSDL